MSLNDEAEMSIRAQILCRVDFRMRANIEEKKYLR